MAKKPKPPAELIADWLFNHNGRQCDRLAQMETVQVNPLESVTTELERGGLCREAVVLGVKKILRRCKLQRTKG